MLIIKIQKLTKKLYFLKIAISYSVILNETFTLYSGKQTKMLQSCPMN